MRLFTVETISEKRVRVVWEVIWRRSSKCAFSSTVFHNVLRCRVGLGLIHILGRKTSKRKAGELREELKRGIEGGRESHACGSRLVVESARACVEETEKRRKERKERVPLPRDYLSLYIYLL